MSCESLLPTPPILIRSGTNGQGSSELPLGASLGASPQLGSSLSDRVSSRTPMSTSLEGRPAWYHPSQPSVSLRNPPLFVGITGGTASGKTSVAKAIIDQVRVPWAVLISMDSFYRPLLPEESAAAREGNYNFDHPSAFDMELLRATLEDLRAGRSVQIPDYDFVTHSRTERSKTVYGAEVIIFEGILAFYSEGVRRLLDIKLFVDEDADTRLARRIRRDISERGRDVDGVLVQYQRFVKPAFDDYILPTKAYADLVVPHGASNSVAINMIAQHIKQQLRDRIGHVPRSPLRSSLASSGAPASSPSNVFLLPHTNEILAIHTVIRDRQSSRGDFVFFTARLARLLMEFSLAQLPWQTKRVVTPVGCEYDGCELVAPVCGVSVMRAGEALGLALREVIKGCELFQLLIQSDKFKQPKLFYCNLPHEIRRYQVILLDPLLATGATTTMAIRILIDHGVPEENITFVCIIAVDEGLRAITSAFPKVRVVTSAIDEALTAHKVISPGVGNFADRFYDN